MKRILLHSSLVILLLLSFASQAQVIYHFAGSGVNGPSTGCEQPAISSAFSFGDHAIFANAWDTYVWGGDLYVCEKNNHRARDVDNSFALDCYAGSNTSGYSGDGLHSGYATLISPHSMFWDTTIATGFIADSGARNIRMVNGPRYISTLAGFGAPLTGETTGTDTIGIDIEGITGNYHGDLYFTDLVHRSVRHRDPAGIITTIAGNGTAAYPADGGPATAASLRYPSDITIDASGNIYFTDSQRVRMINPSGTIATIAGCDISGYLGDGSPATDAHITPTAIAFDHYGCMLIASPSDHRVLRVSPSGTISTLAGNGTWTGVTPADGTPATAAQLQYPSGVTVNIVGDIFISDSHSQIVWLIRSSSVPPPPGTSAVTNVYATFQPVLSLYPNPNPGAFTLLLTTPAATTAHVIITDIAGQNVAEQDIATNHVIPLTLTAPPGLYFITAITPGTKQTISFSIQ